MRRVLGLPAVRAVRLPSYLEVIRELTESGYAA